ncbi:peroxidasin homolog [Brienomyrus brachyistius]|uniref:peroxidasin homolog n=1 Tax=Brienomyrus brachyistius TaxID=42636 RepID=UPI0020B42E56|nr:peroxidasin homolog [Brienomyrus brachyistius]
MHLGMLTESSKAFLWLLTSALTVQVINTCDTTISMQRLERYIGVGQNFTLTCNAQCLDPSSIIQWYLNDKLLSNDSNVKLLRDNSNTYRLNVTAAQMRHNGTYYCQTRPAAATSNNVFMRVVDLDLNVSITSLDIGEGESVSVHCVARSALNATLFWTRGSCERSDTRGGNGTLHLAGATISDSGHYICCATIPTGIPLWRSESVQIRVTASGQRNPIVSNCPLIHYLLGKTAVVLLFIMLICFLTYRRH